MKSVLALMLLAVSVSVSHAQALRRQFGGRTGFTGPAAVKERGVERGRLRYNQNELFYFERLRLGAPLSLILGGQWRRYSLFTHTAPLPARLETVSARVGAEWLIADRWWAFVNLRPGLYGDEDLGSRAFNLPGDVQLNFLPRAGLRLIAGLAVDPYARSEAWPFVGVAWRINRRWNLHAAPPSFRLEYRAYEDPQGPIELFAGLGLSGGSYRVSRSLAARTGRPDLGGKLSHREATLESGLKMTHGGLQGELLGGWQFVRQFEYHEKGVRLDSDGAAFVQASVSMRL